MPMVPLKQRTSTFHFGPVGPFHRCIDLKLAHQHINERLRPRMAIRPLVLLIRVLLMIWKMFAHTSLAALGDFTDKLAAFEVEV
jgi:hypothetical protein